MTMICSCALNGVPSRISLPAEGLNGIRRRLYLCFRRLASVHFPKLLKRSVSDIDQSMDETLRRVNVFTFHQCFVVWGFCRVWPRLTRNVTQMRGDSSCSAMKKEAYFQTVTLSLELLSKLIHTRLDYQAFITNVNSICVHSRRIWVVYGTQTGYRWA